MILRVDKKQVTTFQAGYCNIYGALEIWPTGSLQGRYTIKAGKPSLYWDWAGRKSIVEEFLTSGACEVAISLYPFAKVKDRKNF